MLFACHTCRSPDKEFDISLIVDTDHYWGIVGDKIVRADGPTAVARVFTHWPAPQPENS